MKIQGDVFYIPVRGGGKADNKHWVLNETIDPTTCPNTYINFTARDGVSTCNRISNNSSDFLMYYFTKGGHLPVYSNSMKWAVNNLYNLITFETEPPTELLTWLESNGQRLSEFESGVSKTLNDNTWKQIAVVSAFSHGENFWSVGDVKTIVINGTAGLLTVENFEIGCVILGFNHNSDKEGKNLIHFQMLKSGDVSIALCDTRHGSFSDLATAFTMNTTAVATGGWKDSHMRTVILKAGTYPTNDITGSVQELLPTDLRNCIYQCMKYTDNVGNSMEASSVSSTIDYIFLLSEWEYYGARTMANEAEQNYQQQYDYYKAGNSQAKMRSSRITATARDWCRSPAAGWAGFCHVNTDGTAYYEAPNADLGIAPAFVV